MNSWIIPAVIVWFLGSEALILAMYCHQKVKENHEYIDSMRKMRELEKLQRQTYEAPQRNDHRLGDFLKEHLL